MKERSEVTKNMTGFEEECVQMNLIRYYRDHTNPVERAAYLEALRETLRALRIAYAESLVNKANEHALRVIEKYYNV